MYYFLMCTIHWFMKIHTYQKFVGKNDNDSSIIIMYILYNLKDLHRLQEKVKDVLYDLGFW